MAPRSPSTPAQPTVAAAPAQHSPSVTMPVTNLECVVEVKRMMAAGEFVGTSLRIEVRGIERLDAAPGLCKALGKALGKWKQRVAPHLVCYAVKYFKAKAAAAISKDLRSVSNLIRRISAKPAKLAFYTRLTNIADKILSAATSFPEPARRRVRCVAKRVLRLATRGEKYGETRPAKIRNRAAVVAGKIGRLQAGAVVLMTG